MLIFRILNKINFYSVLIKNQIMTFLSDPADGILLALLAPAHAQTRIPHPTMCTKWSYEKELIGDSLCVCALSVIVSVFVCHSKRSQPFLPDFVKCLGCQFSC